MVRRYLILRGDITDLDFFDAFQHELDALRERTGIGLFYASSDTRPEAGLSRQIYQEDEGRAVVSVVEDVREDLRYIMIESEDPATADTVVRELSAKLDVAPLAELRVAARSAGSDRERARALARLGVAGGERTDRQTEAIVTGALADSSAEVRLAAAHAAGLLRWSEFAPALRTAAQQDSSEKVRAVAEEALRAFGPQSGRGSEQS